MTQDYAIANTRVGKTTGGKYRLVRLIGSGGMGEVYEAQHSHIGRRFAIKFLHPMLASNAEIVARFQREAQAAGSLENENIAAVVDAGMAVGGAPYLVMEYLEGADLAHLLLASGPLPAPRAAYIMIQACRGLAAAHSRGIVHRDLKPENLFVCRGNDGSDLIKVLDFGIAKLHTGIGITKTGTTMGTPFYMSLEQARGAREVDHRTDIYALGVILYELLSGSKPHPGESYNEILFHVLSEEPAPLDSLRPGLPLGLAAVVHKAMAREAEDRYASAADFTAALIPFAGRAVTPLRSLVGFAAVGETVSSPASLPAFAVVAPTMQKTLETPAPAAKRGLPLAMVWGALAAGAALAGFLILWSLPRHEPTQARALAPSAPAPVTVPAPVPAPTPAPAPVPVPAPAAAVIPPHPTNVESPPGRPPGRPPGQRPPKHTGPTGVQAADSRPPHSVIPVAQPGEIRNNPPNSRRKPVRPIDRSNPFAE